MEFLLLKRLDDRRWEALVRPGRRAKAGLRFKISDELYAVIRESTDAGGRIVELEYDGIFEEILDRVGEMPLPPYITERLEDRERYQTVYAKTNGSALLSLERWNRPKEKKTCHPIYRSVLKSTL